MGSTLRAGKEGQKAHLQGTVGQERHCGLWPELQFDTDSLQFLKVIKESLCLFGTQTPGPIKPALEQRAQLRFRACEI